MFNYQIIYRKNKRASSATGKPVWNAILVDPERPVNWDILEDDSKFRSSQWFEELEKLPMRLSGAGPNRRAALKSLEHQAALNALYRNRLNNVILSIVRSKNK